MEDNNNQKITIFRLMILYKWMFYNMQISASTESCGKAVVGGWGDGDGLKKTRGVCKRTTLQNNTSSENYSDAR